MFMLLIFSLLMSVNVKASCRYHTPIVADCNFYSQCLEDKFNCGSEGYPLGYGAKYCERFSSMGTNQAFKNLKFTSKGLKWRDRTLRCLQEDLIIKFESLNTCSEIKSQAFESHASCYTQSDASLCDLGPSDLESVISIVDAIDAFGSYGGVKQLVQVGTTCIPEWVEKMQNIIELHNGFKNRYASLNSGQNNELMLQELQYKIDLFKFLEANYEIQ